jgi:tetratricopeptide (TPR) repeat protein
MYAAREGHAAVARALLDKDADPNRYSEKSWTPLMIAASYGQAEIVAALLDKGADLYTVSVRKETALKLAQSGRHLRVARLLKAAGAKLPVTAKNPDVKWETYVDSATQAYRQGKYGHAEQQLEAALALAEGLGDQDPRLAASLDKLAQLYFAQGKYSKAEPLYERALAIKERMLGPEHLDLVVSLTNLAAVYDAQGKYAQAAPFHRRARAIREKAVASQPTPARAREAAITRLLGEQPAAPQRASATFPRGEIQSLTTLPAQQQNLPD